jgi:polyhydroxybutyrate depolymerase
MTTASLLRARTFGLAIAAILAVAAPALAQGKVMTWRVDGVERQALVFAPAATAPSGKAPVVFFFHGHGGNMRGIAAQTRLHLLWPQAVIVFPQGLPTKSAIDPQGLRPGWQKDNGENGDRDLHFVDAMITRLRADFAIDDARVFASGFSNGAFFTYLLWQARPTVFGGFAVVAGKYQVSTPLATPKPFLQIAGHTDPLVHFDDQVHTIDLARKVDEATGAGQACPGAECTLYPSATHTPVMAIFHPGGHVIPPFAPQRIVDFLRTHQG